jgi:hypothetical protein
MANHRMQLKRVSSPTLTVRKVVETDAPYTHRQIHPLRRAPRCEPRIERRPGPRNQLGERTALAHAVGGRSVGLT